MDKKMLCYGCKQSITLIFKCLSESNHYFCEECFKVFEKKCRCGGNLLRLKECKKISLPTCSTNTNNAGKNCKYKNRGCTWLFDPKYLLLHSEECKYQPFHCIGSTMNIWNCKWQGSKFQIAEHVKEVHRAVVNVFGYQEENVSYHFDMSKCFFKKMDIVEAFNKTFILYYQYDLRTKLIIFIIYLLGTKQGAKKYLYEFEVLSHDVNRKIKIKQPCYNDIGVMNLIHKGKCIILPYQMMQNYLTENTIRIRFRMGRQDN